ncbi:helix-turn-helix domain-containing protein, partial [Enterococcus sp. 12E11_DIV0728]
MLSAKVAARIKELRLQNGLTQETLAELAGLDLSYLGKIERGQIENIKIETLDKIIKAFKIDYPSFFAFKKEDNDISRI